MMKVSFLSDRYILLYDSEKYFNFIVFICKRLIKYIMNSSDVVEEHFIVFFKRESLYSMIPLIILLNVSPIPQDR